MLRPRRLGTQLTKSSNNYTKPYTFLTLSSFTLATIARYSIACFLLAWVEFSRGCSTATQLPVHYPPASDLLKIPQLDDLLYLALPIVLFVVSVAKFTNTILTTSSRDPGVQDRRMTQLFIYAASIQFILIPVTGATAYLLTRHLKEAWFSSGKNILWGVLFASPILLWPAYSIFRAGTQLEPSPMFRFRKSRGWRPFFWAICVLGLLCTLSASVGISYFLAKRDIAGTSDNAPVVSATYLSLQRTGAASFELAILARNNSDTDLWLKSDQVICFARLWTKGKINGAGVRGGFFQIQPKRDTVIPLVITAEYQEDVLDLRPKSLFPAFSAPLQFASVNSDGKWQDLAILPEAGQNLDGDQFKSELDSIQKSLRPH